MNTLSRGTLAVGTTADGTVVFYSPATQPGIRRLDSDLDDLTRFVRIPQLGAFVRELLRDEAQADDDSSHEITREGTP